MIIHSETSLRDFNFWCGGADIANCLSYDQLDTIEEILSDIYPEGINETQLNDLFWFNEDAVAQWLGFTDFEALKKDSLPWK